jgi:hypothetical protein
LGLAKMVFEKRAGEPRRRLGVVVVEKRRVKVAALRVGGCGVVQRRRPVRGRRHGDAAPRSEVVGEKSWVVCSGHCCGPSFSVV